MMFDSWTALGENAPVTVDPQSIVPPHPSHHADTTDGEAPSARALTRPPLTRSSQGKKKKGKTTARTTAHETHAAGAHWHHKYHNESVREDDDLLVDAVGTDHRHISHRDLMAALDADHDGQVTVEELEAFERRTSVAAAVAHVVGADYHTKLWATLDEGGHGRITRRELAHVLSRLPPPPPPAPPPELQLEQILGLEPSCFSDHLLGRVT
jgi:hypothetical protein